jgi:hypothetical protein
VQPGRADLHAPAAASPQRMAVKVGKEEELTPARRHIGS